MSESGSTSWVETTCPPGWDIEESPSGGEYTAERISPRTHVVGPVRDGDGCTVWCASEAHANRLAWERWALGVLGGRAEWHRRSDGIAHSIVCGIPGTWIFVRWTDSGPVFELYTDEHAARGAKLRELRDPVEALARLAALTLAVLGPEVER